MRDDASGDVNSTAVFQPVTASNVRTSARANVRSENIKLLRSTVDTLKEFAAKGKISAIQATRYLRPGVPVPMGDKVARRVERGFGKPEGWLDRIHIGGADRPAEEIQYDLDHLKGEIARAVSLLESAATAKGDLKDKLLGSALEVLRAT